MDPLGLSLAIVCNILGFGIVIYVLLTNIQEKINRDFVLFQLNVYIWNLTVFIIHFIPSKTVAYTVLKIGYISAPALIFTFLQMVHTIIEEDMPLKSKLLWATPLFIFTPLLFTDLYISGIHHVYKNLITVKPGPLYVLFFIAFNVAAIFGFSKCLLSIKKRTGLKRLRIKYITLGYLLAYLGSFLYFATIYKLVFAPIFIDDIFLIFSNVVLTYAILTKKLLSLDIVIKKGVAYTFFITVISILYLLIIFILEKTFQNILGYSNITISLLALISITIIITPLRIFIQDIVNKIFFKGDPLYLAEENKLLKKEAYDKEKFKSIATLASGMAHEIKNPLTAIKAFAEHLPKKKNDEEFISKFSRIVNHEVDRIDSIVNQLLDFAKPTQPKLENHDINQLIKETFDFLNSKFLQHRIKTFHDAQEPLMLPIDKNQMRQVMLNLLLNAIDAMPDGGTITVGSRKENGSAIISITDTGTGISEKDITHIFDPFHTQKDHGTGLGLAICYGIIQEHNGRISVVSKKDEGTTFEIVLPVNQRQSR